MSAYGVEPTPTTTEASYSSRVLSIAEAWRNARENGRFRTVRITVHRVRLKVALKIDAVKSRTPFGN